jgi:hypothetical protein
MRVMQANDPAAGRYANQAGAPTANAAITAGAASDTPPLSSEKLAEVDMRVLQANDPAAGRYTNQMASSTLLQTDITV